jgi:hypothetical protein
VYRIAPKKFLLLASHAGRGARMLEVYPRDYHHVDSPHGARLGGANHSSATCSVPFQRVIETYWEVPFEYQNTVENTYWQLPRPPQTPAAHFKRLYRK